MSASDPPPKADGFRRSVRAVMLDGDDRVLLCRQALHSEPRGIVWAAPGGGVEPGETSMQALARELDEEVGHVLREAVPLVWVQKVEGPGYAEGFRGAVNEYFLLRTSSFTPRGSMTDEQLRQENVSGFRWWSLCEITEYDGPELFSPRELSPLLGLLLRDGVPDNPIQLGL